MIFQQLNAGGDRNFAYLIADDSTGDAALVDPAGRTEEILRDVESRDLTVRYVINTHGHADHTAGNDAVQSATGAKIVRYGHGRAEADDVVEVADGDTLPLGGLTLEFLFTPGHTSDHLCVKCENKLVTGDVLFVGKVGGTRTDDDAREEYDSLARLMALPDEVEVYPGHNYGIAPSSTISHERRSNPFLVTASFKSFLHLKKTWTEYKKEHGIG